MICASDPVLDFLEQPGGSVKRWWIHSATCGAANSKGYLCRPNSLFNEIRLLFILSLRCCGSQSKKLRKISNSYWWTTPAEPHNSNSNSISYASIKPREREGEAWRTTFSSKISDSRTPTCTFQGGAISNLTWHPSRDLLQRRPLSTFGKLSLKRRTRPTSLWRCCSTISSSKSSFCFEASRRRPLRIMVLGQDPLPPDELPLAPVGHAWPN